jgi:phosphatidylinositol alpha-1,6-mannosyltransferase
MLDSGVKPAKGKVILNGADSDQFRILPEAEVEEFKRNFGLNGVRVILTVGNVSRRKGQDLVIKALPRILKEIPNAHYFMAGLPTIQKELQKLADTCEVNDHVHFLGKQDPWMLVRLLNSSDIFVLTSRHTNDGDFEGFGIAVLEAALCGKPAVVSAGAGLEEAIEDGISGILVQSENEEETARAVISLLKNEDLRKRMSVAARRNAIDGDWHKRGREYHDLFTDLLPVTQQLQTSQLVGAISKEA